MKEWYKSRTIWSGVLAIGAGLAGGIGLTIDPMTGDFSGNVYDMAARALPIGSAAASVIAGAGTIFGRVKAEHQIKTKKRAR